MQVSLKRTIENLIERYFSTSQTDRRSPWRRTAGAGLMCRISQATDCIR
jgi:hypothetical protein